MSASYHSSPFRSVVKFSSLGQLPEALRVLKGRKVFIVDEKVWLLYEAQLKKIIGSSTHRYSPDSPKLSPSYNSYEGRSPLILLKATESNKSLRNVEYLLHCLASYNITRNDYIVAIGGGITLDLAGFAASIFKRGCRLAFIPTTFVGMIDASVGGKTGLNYLSADANDIHPKGRGLRAFEDELVSFDKPIKNSIGSFYPANYIFIVMDFLETLSSVDIANGWAECIKVSLIIPNKLYSEIIKSNRIISKSIIREAIRIKEKMCRNDLYDKKARRKLNLGHTTGHLIESVSEFKIPHGQAVALGIRAAAKISLQMGRIDESTYEKIIRPLELFEFSPLLPDEYSKALFNEGKKILMTDKKNNRNVKLVIFTGFQNTRIVAIQDTQTIIDTLLAF